MGKDNCDKCSCELCSVIDVDPINMEKHGAKLLSVTIQVNNVCFDKKVCVACIIYDNCHRILAFRGFCKILCKNNECASNQCGTITKKLVFVLPDDIENPEELDVRCAANYIHPCE